jgi:hypothetical protein
VILDVEGSGIACVEALFRNDLRDAMRTVLRGSSLPSELDGREDLAASERNSDEASLSEGSLPPLTV